MTKNIIYSIYINIPEDKLDNPGWFVNNKQIVTDKSLETKRAFEICYDRLVERHKQYAISINSEYRLYEHDDNYDKFTAFYKENYPEISEYDIVNFYKIHIFDSLANEYNNICYLDFDVVPNTDESIFDKHDIDNSIAVAESNAEAKHGKTIPASQYSSCIRNPATKYWNCHAMLSHDLLNPNHDVFNTGILAASSDVIKKLNYFEDFKDVLNLMTFLKTDENSMYPYNYRRVFGYDNETVFAYKVIKNDVSVDYLNNEWHHRVNNHNYNKNAKMLHFINKKMEWVLD